MPFRYLAVLGGCIFIILLSTLFPIQVEAALSSSPYVDNLMVYADSNHSFCVALVVASKALKDWAGGKDLNGKEVEEEVKKSMQKVRATCLLKVPLIWSLVLTSSRI